MTDTDYKLLDSQLRAMLADETDKLAATSNFVALLFTALDDVNWLGVYVLRGEELVLGPFQEDPRASVFRWARVSAASPQVPETRSELPMCTSSLGILSATPILDRNWSCRCWPRAACSGCWTLTVRRCRGSARVINKASRNSAQAFARFSITATSDLFDELFDARNVLARARINFDGLALVNK